MAKGLSRAETRIARLRDKARAYYYEVMLLGSACPLCQERVLAVSSGQGKCAHGHTFDLTLALQTSSCCKARLKKRSLHYACARCSRTVPSRFLFDERLFDADYFRERMRESRAARRKRRDELRQLFKVQRSEHLLLDGLPSLDDVDGLRSALDGFVLGENGVHENHVGELAPFDMEAYRRLVLQHVSDHWTPFSRIPSLCGDTRVDRARRFVSLIYLWHEREVCLMERNDEVWVEAYEADTER